VKLFSLALSLAWTVALNAAQMAGSSPEFARKPLVQDFYPATSRALGEQGTVKLQLCYDQTGKVVESTVEQSSSFERLDRAAVQMGRQYRINPETVSGQPPRCVVVAVEFILEESIGPARLGEGESSPTLPPIQPPLPPPPPTRLTPPPTNPPPRLSPL
jgi:TonB family protein